MSDDAHRYLACYLACDLGAESGRVMLGTLREGRLALQEAHRFATPAVRLAGSLRWDVLAIWTELQTGLKRAAKMADGPIDGVSVDAWGVDYVLAGGGHACLWPPFHYRDARHAESSRRVRAALGDAFIYSETGVQFLPFNTLYQLAADALQSGPMLARADVFLTIGDWFNHLLSGVAAVDESAASTTQLYDPRRRAWSRALIERAGLPAHLFPRIVPPGTVLGPMLDGGGTQVIATCSHDTGAAVAAVPAGEGDDWAFLSSGTWSLLGAELREPIVTDAARAANFTNEAGFGGTTRFLKNIVGLWVVQELRRAWGGAHDYGSLAEQARAAEPFRSLVQPDDPRFAEPGDMPAKIAQYCRETGQPAPELPGAFARCVLESLALLYRAKLAELEQLTGRTFARVHVVGGGSKNDLFNRFTADATGRTVVAGPTEATAVGNALVQAIALGHVDALASARAIVRASFPTPTFAPSGDPAWCRAFERFVQLPF